MTHDGKDTNRISPASMTAADVAKLLSKVSGESITPEMIERDRNAGAPTNADGTFHLVHYAAWLVRELIQEVGRVN